MSRRITTRADSMEASARWLTHNAHGRHGPPAQPLLSRIKKGEERIDGLPTGDLPNGRQGRLEILSLEQLLHAGFKVPVSHGQ